MTRGRHIVRLMAVAALSAAFSCVVPHGISSVDIDPLGWSEAEPATIVYENQDTLSLYTITIVLRHDRTLTMPRVALDIETSTPDTLKSRERVELPIDLSQVKYSTDMIESEVVYRRGVQFARRGAYRFTFLPERELKGVYAISIDIEKE